MVGGRAETLKTLWYVSMNFKSISVRESWCGKDMELAFAGISCAIDLLEQLFLFFSFLKTYFSHAKKDS